MMAGKGNIQFLSDDESDDESKGQGHKGINLIFLI